MAIFDPASGRAAEVTHTDRHTPAGKLGLMPGDLIFQFGKYSASEILETPYLLREIGREDWILVYRKGILMRLVTGGNMEGCHCIPASVPSDITRLPDDKEWIQYEYNLAADSGIFIVPNDINAAWSVFPLLVFARYRLWNLFVAVVMLYGIGFVLGPLILALIYLTTVILSAFGGVALLRDAAYKQGYIYMGKIGLLHEGDVDRLELMTKKMYEEAEENRFDEGE
jgi:hypothetical protein